MDPTPSPGRATAEAAVRDLVSRASEHQNHPDELLALHTEEAVVVNIAGVRVAGREEFGDVMRRSLQGRLSDVRTRVEISDVTFLRPDVTLVSCVKHVDDTNPDADAAALPLTGALTYVVVDDGVGWRIALAQTTPRAVA